MRLFGLIAVALPLVLSAATAAARAENRTALLIGNQGYNNSVGPLRNPHKDIVVVGKALTEVGFKLLAPRKDATRDEILFAVYELAAQARSDEKIVAYSTATGKKITAFGMASHDNGPIVVTSDGALVLAANGSRIDVWRANTQSWGD